MFYFIIMLFFALMALVCCYSDVDYLYLVSLYIFAIVGFIYLAFIVGFGTFSSFIALAFIIFMCVYLSNVIINS